MHAGESGSPDLTLYPIQYRSKAKNPGADDIAVAGCNQQWRTNSVVMDFAGA